MITCTYALGPAIPLVNAISTAKASRSGIFVTDRIALERMRTIDAVLFDKTRTLTRAGYNILAIPLAAGVLTLFGSILPMALGVVLMSASTVVVALSAQLLRRVQFQGLQRPQPKEATSTVATSASM